MMKTFSRKLWRIFLRKGKKKSLSGSVILGIRAQKREEKENLECEIMIR
jgi:hypothetical protein